MGIKAKKTRALVMLKGGKSIEEVAKEVDLFPAIIQEFFDNMTDEELDDKELQIYATEKAVDIVKEHSTTAVTKASIERLDNKLAGLAEDIADQIINGLSDHGNAKALNTSADTITKLQNTFGKPKAKPPTDVNITTTVPTDKTNKYKEISKF